MTVLWNVAALLRRLLGVAQHLELQPAILAMNLATGINDNGGGSLPSRGGGSLPSQVAVSPFIIAHSPVKIEGQILNPWA